MSTIIQDVEGNFISELDTIGGQAILDTRVFTQTLAALNAQSVLYCKNTNAIAIEVRGTFVGTMLCQYSIDGTNYDQCSIFNPVTELFLVNISASGKYICVLPNGVKQMRLLMSSFTSGAAFVSLRGAKESNFTYVKPLPISLSVTATAAVSAGVTATLPAPGASLFHFITKIRISKYVAANLTASATPSIVTSTNIPGTPSFDFKTLGSLGDNEILNIDFSNNPLKSITANTASTFVAPILTGAIWKIQIFYYIA